MNVQQPGATATGRDTAIDVLRALCILYIVAFWHLVPYTQSFPGYANVYTECIKDIALGTFVFCSGLLLSARPVALTVPELLAFYRRRVLRIYPLYVVALLGLGLIGMANSDVIGRALLLVSMFLPPAPYTLWFITMIMAFYLVTPFLLRLAAAPRAYLATGLLLLVLLALWHNRVHVIDTRLLQYLPCFLCGIAWQRIPALPRAVSGRVVWLATGGALTFALYGQLHGQGLDAALGRIPTILSGTVLVYLLATRYASGLRWPLVTQLAYASFGIYLFHRVVFHYAIGLYFPDGAVARLLYLDGVVIPVIAVLAYAVQRGYDRLLRLL